MLHLHCYVRNFQQLSEVASMIILILQEKIEAQGGRGASSGPGSNEAVHKDRSPGSPFPVPSLLSTNFGLLKVTGELVNRHFLTLALQPT